MTAALLSPGPSLSRLPAMPDAHLVVAVNRAVLAFPDAHTWACSDYPLVKYHHAACRARTLLTRSQTWVDVQRFPAVAAMSVAIVEDLAVPVADWSRFTATSALGFLWTIGAKRIDVYGADMVGTLDFDDAPAGENRSEDRWAAEREIWHRLAAWMGGMGVEVVRHA
jgi:hypothetical protein